MLRCAMICSATLSHALTGFAGEVSHASGRETTSFIANGLDRHIHGESNSQIDSAINSEVPGQIHGEFRLQRPPNSGTLAALP